MTRGAVRGLAFAVVVALWALPAAAQRGTMLAWRWDEGSVRRYRLTQEMHQAISGLQERELSWTVSYLVRQEVRSVAAATGVATVAQTYESGVVVASEEEERVEYDSSKPDAAEKAKHRLIAPYAAFVGETLVFQVDREGKVLSLEGAEKILAKAMSGLSQSNPMLAPLLEGYSQSLNDEGMRAELERQLRVVPGRSVSPKDTWKVTATQAMPLVGTVQHETTYTLEGVRKVGETVFAQVGAEGTLSQAGAPPQGDALGALLEVKLVSSSVKGQTRFAVEEGALASSSYTVETVWEIGIRGGGELEEALRDLGGGGGKMEQRLRQRGGMELVVGDARR